VSQQGISSQVAPVETTGRATTPVSRAANIATWIMLGVFPLALALFILSASFVHNSLAYDFRHAYLPAAHALVHNESPYTGLDDPDLALETAYVYPPLVGYALIPFTPLSTDAASVIATLIAIALLFGALLVLDVRDWRCFGALALWAPWINAVHTASTSALLAFACALAWRYRATVGPLATSLGLGIAAKLVLWPLFAWTLSTRRVRATVWASVVAFTFLLLSWSAIPGELEHYPALLRRLAQLEAEKSYSLAAVFATVGLGGALARILGVAVGVALIAACVELGRRGDDFRSFVCALAAVLAFTPVLWQHYLVLLLVPLAIARPRFSAIWLVPTILWIAPRTDNGTGIETLLPVLVTGFLLAFLLTPTRPLEALRSQLGARP